MATLSRKDQQVIVTQYEREYGKLVMAANEQGMSCNTVIQAHGLFKEVRKITTAQEHLFDEDITELLQGIYHSIKDNILTKQSNKAA